VTNLRPDVVARLDAIAAAFRAHGMGPAEARTAALQSVARSVSLQGAVLGFEKTFLLQGVAFLVVLPLLFFLRVGGAKEAAHVEINME